METMNPALLVRASIEAAATRYGRDAGETAGSWLEVTDPADAVSITTDVDPEVMDRYAPRGLFAHEYADDPTIAEGVREILAAADCYDAAEAYAAGEPYLYASFEPASWEDEILTAAEDAYQEAWGQALERAALATLESIGV